VETWDDVDRALAAAPGVASAWIGPVGGPPAYARAAGATHYAASTMKVGVLVALHRAAAAGRIDLDASVTVHNRHRSAVPGAPDFANTPEEDSDTETWTHLGSAVPLRWLARRMIVRSGNLATNLCLAAVGQPAVEEVWALAGARHSVTGRGIEDAAAREAGLDNRVTAADLAALLGAITTAAAVTGPTTPPAARPDATTTAVTGPTHPAARPDATTTAVTGPATHPTAPPDATATATATAAIVSGPAAREILGLLEANEHRDDLAAGLPDGARIAHKNGWVDGVRHGAGVVFPGDAPAYTVVVCTSTGLPDAAARALVAEVSAAAWRARHRLTPAAGPAAR